MSVASNNGNAAPVSKRSACERCRSQKLRCPPSVDRSESCARCQRLGAHCSFVSSLPTPNHDPFTNNEFWQSINRGMPKENNSASSNFVFSPHSGPPSHSHLLSPRDGLQRNDSIYVKQRPVGLPPQPEFPPSTTIGTFPSCATDDSDSHFSNSALQSSLADDSMFMDLLASPMTTPDLGMPAIEPHTPQQLIEPIASDYSNSALSREARLLRLGISLTEQFEHWLRVERSQTRSGTHSAHNEQLMEEAVRSLSDFLVVIHAYSSTNTNAAGRVSRVSSLAVLHLISSYFRLITIYDKLFISLCTQMIDEESGTDSHPQLGFSALGTSSTKKSLHARILIHAILHQFEAVERMLGLPVDFRVTAKREAYAGIFVRDERLRAILTAIGSGFSSHTEEDEDQEMKSLLSLRASIAKVQAIVGV